MHPADVSTVYEKKAAGGGQHQAAGHFAGLAGHAAAKPPGELYYIYPSLLCKNYLPRYSCHSDLPSVHPHADCDRPLRSARRLCTLPSIKAYIGGNLPSITSKYIVEGRACVEMQNVSGIEKRRHVMQEPGSRGFIRSRGFKGEGQDSVPAEVLQNIPSRSSHNLHSTCQVETPDVCRMHSTSLIERRNCGLAVLFVASLAELTC